MINPWKLLPPWGKYAAVGLALLGSILLILSKVDRIHDNGVSQGVNQERATTAEAVIERVEISRAATQEIEAQAAAGSGSLLYAQCLRSARTPANCKRFLPKRSETER